MAGLRALGFGRTTLAGAANRLGSSRDSDEITFGAPDDRPFALLMVPLNSAIGGPPAIDVNPVFAVPKAQLDAYDELIRWLTEHSELPAVAD